MTDSGCSTPENSVNDGRLTMPQDRPVCDEMDLVRRLKKSDRNAFVELVAMYQGRVFNTVFRYTGDRHIAEDLTQEVFVKILGALDAFQEKSALSTWIYRITLNHCASEARRLSTRKRKMEVTITPADPSGEEGQMDLGDSSSDPARNVEEAERSEIIQKAILTLDPEFREALVLRDVDGFSYEEIAEIIRKPVGTVRSRIHRARLELREKLKKYVA